MISLFASYMVAMTVVLLFCAKLIRLPAHQAESQNAEAGKKEKKHLGWTARSNVWFNAHFTRFLDRYEGILSRALVRPLLTIVVLLGLFVES